MRAAVAIGAVETEGDDAMLAEGAFERGDRFGCVISHVLTVALLPVPVWGNRCATLEQETRNKETLPRVRMPNRNGFVSDPRPDTK